MEELYKNICNNTTIKNYNKIRRLNLLNLLIQCQHFYKNENHSFDFIAPVLDNNTESKFIKKCKKSKVDGLIVVDLPYPENKIFASKCKKNNINFIQLISPTTSKERLKQILKDSHDMIYYISMLSTTGGKLKVSSKNILREYVKIKNQNKLKNVVIGFGITQKTIKSLRKADGLVVGSEICKEITRSIKKKTKYCHKCH